MCAGPHVLGSIPGRGTRSSMSRGVAKIYFLKIGKHTKKTPKTVGFLWLLKQSITKDVANEHSHPFSHGSAADV